MMKRVFISMGVGLILFVMFTIVLFKNEGAAVNRAKVLDAVDLAIEVENTETETVSDGEIILIYGRPESKQELNDEVFGVCAPKNTVKLSRSVKMYQWKESLTTDDGETLYSYEKAWEDTLVRSSDFHNGEEYENPSEFLYHDDLFVRENISIGAYRLDNVFVDQLNNYTEFYGVDTSLSDTNMSIEMNKIFISADGDSSINNPAVGDYIIEYSIVPTEVISAVGAKKGDTLISYHTKAGELAEVSYGTLSKQTLKSQKIDESNAKAWFVRIGSLLALVVACRLLFSPITKTIGEIPLLGSIVNGSIALISVVAGITWGIVVISAGWILYRPFVAIGLILLVIASIMLVSRMKATVANEKQQNQDKSEVLPR